MPGNVNALDEDGSLSVVVRKDNMTATLRPDFGTGVKANHARVLDNSDADVGGLASRITADQFSSRNPVYKVGSEAESSVLPAKVTVVDVDVGPLSVGGKPVLFHPESNLEEWQKLLSDEFGTRPHSDGCPHRRVCVSCCGETMPQHECRSHRGCGKSFQGDPIDPVDLSRKGE